MLQLRSGSGAPILLLLVSALLARPAAPLSLAPPRATMRDVPAAAELAAAGGVDAAHPTLQAPLEPGAPDNGLQLCLEFLSKGFPERDRGVVTDADLVHTATLALRARRAAAWARAVPLKVFLSDVLPYRWGRGWRRGEGGGLREV